MDSYEKYVEQAKKGARDANIIIHGTTASHVWNELTWWLWESTNRISWHPNKQSLKLPMTFQRNPS